MPLRLANPTKGRQGPTMQGRPRAAWPQGLLPECPNARDCFSDQQVVCKVKIFPGHPQVAARRSKISWLRLIDALSLTCGTMSCLERQARRSSGRLVPVLPGASASGDCAVAYIAGFGAVWTLVWANYLPPASHQRAQPRTQWRTPFTPRRSFFHFSSLHQS
jgi:hypothetical protein